VVEAFRSGVYRVTLDDGAHDVLAYTGGRMRKFRIRIVVGDRVKVELSPYDLGRGPHCVSTSRRPASANHLMSGRTTAAEHRWHRIGGLRPN
jgi:translation initiation factor IF-1